MASPLSQTQVVEYHRTGFLFPLAVLSPDEVLNFRAGLEDLDARLKARGESLPLWQCHLHFRWAFELATHPGILQLVERIIGPNILVHTSSVFRKNPGDPAGIPWHQDGYYWRMSPPRLVSAWIALTNSSVESGCMRVIPGSHRKSLPHVSIKGSSNMLASGLTLERLPEESTAVDVILLPGEVSLHHLNLVHGSKPNTTGKSRIGFAIRYAATEVRQELPHHAVVLARGLDDYHNFELLNEPPGDSIEQGIESLTKLVARIRRLRLA